MTLKKRTRIINLLKFGIFILWFVLGVYKGFDSPVNEFIYSITLVIIILLLTLLEYLVIRSEKKKGEYIFFSTKYLEKKNFNDYVIYLLVGLTVLILVFGSYSAVLKGNYSVLVILLGPFIVWLFKVYELPIYIQDNIIFFPQYYRKQINIVDVSNTKIISAGKIEVKVNDKVETIFMHEEDAEKLVKIIEKNKECLSLT